MNSNQQHDGNVEQVLRRSRFATPPGLDERILSAATRELAHAAAPRRPSVWFWRRAAMLLFGIGAVAAIVAYFDRPSLTLAQVNDAIALQTWVHLKYDNGREEWTNLVDGRTFFRDHDGRSVYTEPDGIRLWWWGLGTSYITRGKWFVGDRPPAEPAYKTPWEQFVRPLEERADRDLEQPRVERHPDTLDGRHVLRFDCFKVDAMGRRLLIQQVWADPATRLPVQVRSVLELAERNQQNREAIVGRYDFPATGPSTLQDIGVPAGLAIIDTDAEPSAEVAAILDAAKAARQRWPKTYRLIRWLPDRIWGEVDRIYIDGNRLAWTRWAGIPAEGAPDLPPPPIGLQQVLPWLDTRPPMEVFIEDGTRKFRRFNDVTDQPNRQPSTIRVMPQPRDRMDDSNTPPGVMWPYGGSHLEKVDGPEGLIVLRRTRGDERYDYWIDPSRDYICLRQIRQKQAEGEWTNFRIEILTELKQLSNGSWYPTLRTIESYNPPVGTQEKTGVQREAYHVTIIRTEDIPPGTFNGETLLEGAKLETY